MADDYSRDLGKNDNAAKTPAIIGIVLVIIVLGWAIKADNHAGEAEYKAEQTSQTAQ